MRRNVCASHRKLKRLPAHGMDVGTVGGELCTTLIAEVSFVRRKKATRAATILKVAAVIVITDILRW